MTGKEIEYKGVKMDKESFFFQHGHYVVCVQKVLLDYMGFNDLCDFCKGVIDTTTYRYNGCCMRVVDFPTFNEQNQLEKKLLKFWITDSKNVVRVNLKESE